MTAIAYVVVVTDGSTLRTIHPAAVGPGSAEVERVLRAHLFGPVSARLVPAATESTLTQREMAAAQGFTGDAYPNYGGFSMKRAGTCLTCQACGSTTGCG